MQPRREKTGIRWMREIWDMGCVLYWTFVMSVMGYFLMGDVMYCELVYY